MPHARHDRSIVAMSTIVSISVVLPTDTPATREACARAIDRACEWFTAVEATCSRFLDDSEVSLLSRTVGEPVRVSPMLLEAVRFAVAVAADTDGAFDPTVGALMAARGFDVDDRSGERIQSPGPDTTASYRDITIDEDAGTITLARPLVLDLGAVAKGLAVDMAASELRPLRHFAIDAGGDLFLSGLNGADQPWSVGIRHPLSSEDSIEVIEVSDAAVCTSGGYERPSPDPGVGHHIVDPRTRHSANRLASATVVAPTAIVADALATAAFVLGPRDALAFLARHGVNGITYTPDLQRLATPGF